MSDLTTRLLDPEKFVQATEACLSNPYQAHLCIGFFAEAVEELHARLATAKAEGAAAREDTVRLADSWRPVDLGPKGEWFMGRLKDGTEKWLRRLPDGSSYEYSDVTFTYYSWYWLTHWRPLADAEQAAIDSARAGGGK